VPKIRVGGRNTTEARIFEIPRAILRRAIKFADVLDRFPQETELYDSGEFLLFQWSENEDEVGYLNMDDSDPETFVHYEAHLQRDELPKVPSRSASQPEAEYLGFLRY
jgi:hypothetical protein